MSPDASLEDLLQELSAIRALDFRGYKKASLERRLRKRLGQLNIPTYGEYLEYFHSHPGEIDHLLEVVLINVTRFFRDPAAWEALRNEAFPLILKGLKPGDTFRAWCAGCSTGEEVYSTAILLAEEFGPRLKKFEVKIYATDHDEQALNVARRAEYPRERVTLLDPEWRRKYFVESGNTLRLNRDLRRLAIFGSSNLVKDAPISHVKLLICRNVLIYFDLGLQREVLRRFRYALEPGGVLFLGKAESQLRDSAYFHPVSFRWRVFQSGPTGGKETSPNSFGLNMDQRDHGTVDTIQRSLLETIRGAIIVLDNDGKVLTCSDSARKFWGIPVNNIEGRLFHETELAHRCPDLAAKVERSRSSTGADTVRFQCRVSPPNGAALDLEVTVRPILNSQGNRVGTLIYADDISSQQKLRATVEELEATAEELHSANEELETTNEELQSTNEELETTNEELQSTNEELETTNEELHSLNEELETTNDELESRTHDLEELATRYSEILGLMPAPVVLTNERGEVTLFNAAAERLFGLSARGLTGLLVHQLPFESGLRSMLHRRQQQVVSQQKVSTIRRVKVSTGGFEGTVDIRVMPISTAAGRGVMITFDPNLLTPPRAQVPGRSDKRSGRKPVKKSSKSGKSR
jgi:two-component system CheB/CheR fusion protein